MTENTVNINSNETWTTPDFSILFKQKGRPKMKPEDKKPRKRKSKLQAIAEIHPYLQPQVEQTEGPKDDLQLKIHKLEALKSEWNEYYRRNRDRILSRKKQLREAKEMMVNECLGIEKVERRGRKCKEINMERIGMIKCLQ
jgi:chromosome segregation ATPase